MPTACLLIIGNEILSGRTQDVHLCWLAKELGGLGILLREGRVVPDVEEAIVEAVNQCRTRYDYVFTTGGIGPTHDDITASSIARAFDRPFGRNKEAEAALRAFYPAEKLNEARLSMADMPEGASLIPNGLSAAPGFIIENVYVLAGVPEIMRAMFAALKPTLHVGLPVRSTTLTAQVTEGNIAKGLAEIQQRHKEVEIGSYPFSHDGKLGVSIVLKGTGTELIAKAAAEVRVLLSAFDPNIREEAA